MNANEAAKLEATNEETMEDAMRVLRADHWQYVRGLAEEAEALCKSGELADAEALDEWLHETVDGSDRVIYTWKAQRLLLCTENQDAMADEYGTEGLVEDGSVNWGGMAYHALLADVRELLTDVQFPAESEA
jgi:hypothetical protein